VISFTLQPFYLWEKSPQYPLDTRLGGRQSRSGCGDVGKKSPINVPPPPPGSEPQSVCKNVWQKTQDEVHRAPGGGGVLEQRGQWSRFLLGRNFWRIWYQAVERIAFPGLQCGRAGLLWREFYLHHHHYQEKSPGPNHAPIQMVSLPENKQPKRGAVHSTIIPRSRIAELWSPCFLHVFTEYFLSI
jgi:hypothetical protein